MDTSYLTNFNAPIDTRNRFDAICHASGRTRTSVLVELMTDYILHQSELLATRSLKFNQVDQMLGDVKVSNGGRLFESRTSPLSRNRSQSRSNQDFELPDAFVSDGQGDW